MRTHIALSARRIHERGKHEHAGMHSRMYVHASKSDSQVCNADVSSSRAILHKSPPAGHPCMSFVRSASSYPCGHWHCEPIILSRVCGRSEWPLMRVLVLVRPRAVFALDLAPRPLRACALVSPAWSRSSAAFSAGLAPHVLISAVRFGLC